MKCINNFHFNVCTQYRRCIICDVNLTKGSVSLNKRKAQIPYMCFAHHVTYKQHMPLESSQKDAPL